MKKIPLMLADPDNPGQKISHWFSTPTPYILELMAEMGVDFNMRAPEINPDAILAISEKQVAAMTPDDRKKYHKLRKRLDAMTPEEAAAAREEVRRSGGESIKVTNATLAAFLTMNEPEDPASGMPAKIWSRKQAADLIPWDGMNQVHAALTSLIADAQSGDTPGEPEAVQDTATNAAISS